jgi:hypothetical protein
VEKSQGHENVKVWCGIKSTDVFETIIFGHSLNAMRYAQMLKNKLCQSSLVLDNPETFHFM